ncbi:MAG: hypothetical protein NZO58_13805 [Gemmataceae bacterium]|nr:hypothetical protein [Gemmataceae bacterium]
MNREAIMDKGERVFVLSVALVLGAETLFTIMATGQDFAWPRLLLGIFGGVFIIVVGQRLYAGDRGIANVAIAWSAFQLVLMAASLVVGPEPREGVQAFIQSLGLPIRYLALLKALAYGTFLCVLVVPCSARAFLAQRRGDDVVKFLPPDVADEGGPIAWTAEHVQQFGNVAGWMLGAATVLALIGLMILLRSIPPSLQLSRLQVLGLVEALLLIALGGLLTAPALALRNLTTAEGGSKGDLKVAVRRLGVWHLVVAGCGVAWAVVVVVRFPFN